MDITPKRIRILTESGFFKNKEAITKAFQQTKNSPSKKSWQEAIKFYLLLFGGLSFAAAVTFFIAANWQELGKFFKLGLVTTAIIVSSLLAAFLDTKKLSGKITGTVSGLLIGPLFALYSQIYQTGADNYELFTIWGLLLIPFVTIVRFNGLLLFNILLFNLSYYLWSDATIGFNTLQTNVPLVMITINVVAIIAMEYAKYQKVSWLQSRVPIHILTAVTLLIGLVPATTYLFESTYRSPYSLATTIYFFICCLVTILIYWKKTHNLNQIAIAITYLAIYSSLVTAKLFFDTSAGLRDNAILLEGLAILFFTYLSVKAIQFFRQKTQ